MPNHLINKYIGFKHARLTGNFVWKAQIMLFTFYLLIWFLWVFWWFCMCSSRYLGLCDVINCTDNIIGRIKRDIYEIIFTLQGVECFDYNKKVNTLLTGSVDHTVRVWNPYVPSKPIAVLEGHHLGIVDVKIHPHLGMAFSLAKDNVSSARKMQCTPCLHAPCSHDLMRYWHSVVWNYFAVWPYWGTVSRIAGDLFRCEPRYERWSPSPINNS